MPLITRVLFATDFSGPADRAQEYAVALASAFGAKLLILHAFEAPFVPVPDSLVYTPVIDIERSRAQFEQALRAAKKRAVELGARDVEAVLIEGQPWREIVRVAADRGCDLIVLGTHGRSGISHLFLGSVAEKVARHAECPVLTVSDKERSAQSNQRRNA